MVNAVHLQLTPNVYHFIFDASNVEDGDQNRAPNAEQKVRRAKKEGKQIGLLVKAIEEWEINLIKLTLSCESCRLHLQCRCCNMECMLYTMLTAVWALYSTWLP